MIMIYTVHRVISPFDFYGGWLVGGWRKKEMDFVWKGEQERGEEYSDEL